MEIECAYSQNGNRMCIYHDNIAQYNGMTYQTTDPLCITRNNIGNDSIIITSSGLTNEIITFNLIYFQPSIHVFIGSTTR